MSALAGGDRTDDADALRAAAGAQALGSTAKAAPRSRTRSGT